MKGKDIIKEAKDGETDKLKRRIRRLELEKKDLTKENNKLKSELGTLELAFDETKKFLKDTMKDYSVEEAIERAKKTHKRKKEEKKRKAAKEVCPKCGNHEVKLIPSRAGTIIVCGKCEHREVKKNAK